MKFPRFIGGFAVGAGLTYLLSSKNVKITPTKDILPHLIAKAVEKDPEMIEVASLMKEKTMKELEVKRLLEAFMRKSKEEMKSDPTGQVKRKMIAAWRHYIILRLKRDIDHLDSEIKWVNDQLSVEGLSHEGEVKKVDQPGSEIIWVPGSVREEEQSLREEP